MDMTAAGARVPSLTVFFPAFNEEDIIEKTVTDALSACAPLADDLEVVVVDDGSADQTPAIVERMAAADPRVRLIKHERNLGYGAALRTGFAGAHKDLVFFSDADGQFDLHELPGSLAMLSQAPVVVGFRIKRNDPPHRLFIAKTYKLIVRLMFGLPVRDIDCAFKLFRRKVFDGLTLESNGAFISSELLIKLSRRGVPIAERGVHHYPRTTGYSKGAGVSVILKTIRDILRLRFGMSLASSR
jgi:glycosyltransferase involved in cell wall biosynthesis